MFYCEACRKKNRWLRSAVKSCGACEMCGIGASCYDMPSSFLSSMTEKAFKEYERI